MITAFDFMQNEPQHYIYNLNANQLIVEDNNNNIVLNHQLHGTLKQILNYQDQYLFTISEDVAK